MALRVIQWSTGNVGKTALKAVIERSDLELVGVYAQSKDKVGKDAGDLVGLGKTGVVATDDLDKLLRLKVDCVLHMPLPSAQFGSDPGTDLRNICRLLEAGKNVITTVGYLYPKAYGADTVRALEAACAKGQASVHGTGLNPGWQGELLPLTMSSLVRRVDRIHVLESTDFAGYPSPEVIFGLMGMGKKPADFEAGSKRYVGWITGLFSEAIMMIADGIGAPLDRIDRTYEVLLADRPLDIAAGRVEPGTVAAQKWKWAGIVGGRELIVHETHWRAHGSLGKDWSPLGGVVRVEGQPTVEIKFGHSWISDGLAATAMHAVNAIPAVCAAKPGIRSFLDLPLIAARYQA